MTSEKRSLYWVLVGPVIALALAATRLAMQGSVKLYTEPDKQLYLPDPDLGHKLSGDTYHWLGLERTAAIVFVGGFLLVATFLLLRRERKKEISMKRSRLALHLISPLPLIIPIIALLGGTPPDGARTTAEKVGGAVEAGFDAGLANAPAGVYKALEHEGSIISASLKAGGDSFEAKFTKGLRGNFTGSPKDLSKPVKAEIFVSAKDVKTGIDLRNTHAGDYLKVDEFPDLGFRLNGITGATKGETAGVVRFSGDGQVVILGKEIATPVTGTARELDDAGKKRLGIGAEPAMVVNASMSIRISETPIEADGDFDRDEIPITVSLVLTYQGES